ncbi:SRPBCC domain-containing protein [Leucobacter sp. PH1c]|uniref:SRPBCC family protein n=1 Tax=Leucobacter sp. PH1c TaxID=1397278 RepID=UPI0009DDF1FE|nr:SRPBCC domain-containing protein [Leucobacter sp. PH1c]
MIPLGPVVARSRLRAERTAAWSYLSEADRRAEWWPELELEPRVGGAISERWSEESGETSVSRDASGAVDVWVEGHAIGFRWREAGDERDTAVLMTLRTQGMDTGITVTETGFDALPDAAARAAASQDGWQVLLRDLTAALEAAVAEGRIAAPLAIPEPAEEEPAAEPQAAQEAGDAAAAAGDAELAGEGAADESSVDETGTGESGAEVVDAEVVDAEVVEAEESRTEEVDAQAEAEPAEAKAEPAEAEVDADADADADEEANDTIRIEPLTPEAAAQIEAAVAETETEAEAEPEAEATEPEPEATEPEPAEPEPTEPEPAEPEPTTAELDFDALIRGDLPDGSSRER